MATIRKRYNNGGRLDMRNGGRVGLLHGGRPKRQNYPNNAAFQAAVNAWKNDPAHTSAGVDDKPAGSGVGTTGGTAGAGTSTAGAGTTGGTGETPNPYGLTPEQLANLQK